MTSKCSVLTEKTWGQELSGKAAKASREVARKNITYSQNNQLPDGLIARLVEHCIGTSVVKI